MTVTDHQVKDQGLSGQMAVSPTSNIRNYALVDTYSTLPYVLNKTFFLQPSYTSSVSRRGKFRVLRSLKK